MPNTTNATATSWIAKFQQTMTALGATGFTMEEFNSAFVPEASVIGDWPENTRLPALFFSLPVRDMEKANGIVAAVTAVANEDRPWTRSSKDGVQYYTLPPANPMIPVSPTIAVDNDLLVVGVDPVSVESAMTRGSDGGAGLAATSEFKTAEALVPKPAQSFIFVDTALLYGRLDAAVRPMLVMAAAFMPGIANKVDLGKFPPPDVITRHLSPIVVSQNYRNDGYVTESVGPISVYQAVLGIAGASGAGADFYQGQTGSGIPGGIAAPTTPNVSSSPTATVAPPPPAAEESDESPPEP